MCFQVARDVTMLHSISGVYFFGVLLFLAETRADIILTRLARKMRQTKQDSRYHARAEIDKHSLFTLIKISSTRPISEWCFPNVRNTLISSQRITLDRTYCSEF